MKTDETLLTSLGGELRRGTLVLAVLLMADSPAYGYSLVQDLQAAGIDVEQNTLYPLLRRMETQGLLQSSWDTGESRPRKYYRATDAGLAMRTALKEEWDRLNAVIDGLAAE